jgi:hypothetical protein
MIVGKRQTKRRTADWPCIMPRTLACAGQQLLSAAYLGPVLLATLPATVAHNALPVSAGVGVGGCKGGRWEMLVFSKGVTHEERKR